MLCSKNMIIKTLNKIRFVHTLTLAVIITFLFSCSSNLVFRENKHIAGEGWQPTDSVTFSFTVSDTLQPVDLFFNIRNTTAYSFQNLYFFITTVYPGGDFSRDTAECILAAPDGKWLGKGSGHTRDSKFLFRKAVRFAKPGNYKLIVNQAMRGDLLKGISDVGLIIEKPNN